MPIQKLLPVGLSGPLDATRAFLRQVWDRAPLDGLFIPAWTTGEGDPRPALLNSPAQLDRADPFAPLMVLNTAPHVLALHADHPRKRIGAVLRPCELRSLRELARIQRPDMGGFLLISSDCLATFPREDFDWRVQHAADIEKITDEALHFASQGGYSPAACGPRARPVITHSPSMLTSSSRCWALRPTAIWSLASVMTTSSTVWGMHRSLIRPPIS